MPNHAGCNVKPEVRFGQLLLSCERRCVTLIRTCVWIRQIITNNCCTYLLFCSQSEPHTCPFPCRFPSSCHTSGSARKTPAKTFHTCFLFLSSGHGDTHTSHIIICLLVQRRWLHELYSACSLDDATHLMANPSTEMS